MSRSWDGSSPAGIRAAGEVGQGTGALGCQAPAGVPSIARRAPEGGAQPSHTSLLLPPADDSLYESPEPIFTSNNSCCSLRVPHAALVVVPVFWTLLAS